MLYDVGWSKTYFEFLLVEKNSVLLGCADHLFKLQDVDHQRDGDQSNSTSAQLATYPANKQAKVEVGCVQVNINLEQSLQQVGVHFPAER